jgi:hypothetical protein
MFSSRPPACLPQVDVVTRKHISISYIQEYIPTEHVDIQVDFSRIPTRCTAWASGIQDRVPSHTQQISDCLDAKDSLA